jgi:outer membrane protein assembly factor BamA
MRSSRCVLGFLAVSLASGAARTAHADDAAPTPMSSIAAVPPEELGRKQRLHDEDLARKREGGYFTGLPLANYDHDIGFGFGARVYYFDDGKRSDPLFAYTPYEQRIFAQAFASTGGVQYHWLDYDAPHFFGSLFRVRASFEYQENTRQNYFGTGTRSMQPLSFPGSPQTFAHASEYDTRLRALQPDGSTYALYDKYSGRRPQLGFAAERHLLGGLVRALFGLGFSNTVIHQYTGTTTDADGATGTVQAPEAPTRLTLDCAAGRIVGCAGGWDNVLRLGLSLDTRDFEPDPNSGVYAELSTEYGLRGLGSDYAYARVMGSVRGFYSPIPKLADLVLAGRGVYEVQTRGTPFFSMSNLPFIEDNHAGLGGFRTLRGFRDSRFVGPVIALTNYEVRWTFLRFRALDQTFGLIAVPFLDIGRVFDNVATTSFKDWKRTQGGGFRIAWNEATIIMADYGFSDEDAGLYVNFNHIF